jgi:hypothetical protein
MALPGLAAPAQAEIEYPWCADYSGERNGGGTNCGFVTRAQCMATISGIGGWCRQNGAYGRRADSRNANDRRRADRPGPNLDLRSLGSDAQSPWCADFTDIGSTGGTDCSFATRAQCLATISGVGGQCRPNGAYVSRAEHMRVRKPPRKKH